MGISYNFWWYVSILIILLMEQIGLEPITFRLWAELSNQLKYCSVYDKNLGTRVELALFNRLPIVSTNSFQQDLNINWAYWIWTSEMQRSKLCGFAACRTPISSYPLNRYQRIIFCNHRLDTFSLPWFISLQSRFLITF